MKDVKRDRLNNAIRQSDKDASAISAVQTPSTPAPWKTTNQIRGMIYSVLPRAVRQVHRQPGNPRS